MPRPSTPLALAVILPAFLSSGLPLALADPLPIAEPWCCGRVVPATTVPVDMVSEGLRAKLGPLPKVDRYGQATGVCMADVDVEYVLRADAPLTVPVLLPVVLRADRVRFELNGQATPVRLLHDTRFLTPYEPVWRETINALLAGDPVLKQIVDEAKTDLARRRRQVHERAAAGGDDPEVPGSPIGDTLDISRRLCARLAPRLEQLGRPAAAVVWGLMHYIVDDWEDVHSVTSAVGERDPNRRERTRLWTLRDVAVALDPDSPDPVALWSPSPSRTGHAEMSFAVARLQLRAGDNDLRVHYRQRTSFANRLPPRPDVPGIWLHRQVMDFRFILQTARFWRSFGELRVDVELPTGVTFAECSLPEAAVDSETAPRRVTYSGQGLPAKDLSVLFADFVPLPPEENSPPTAAVAVRLPLLWQTVVTREVSRGAAAPLADGDTVVCAVENRAVVCDRDTGDVLRTLDYAGAAYGVALLPDRLLVGMSCPSDQPHAEYPCVASFDRSSGRCLWTAGLPPETGLAFSTRPVVAGATVLGWTPGHSLFAARLADGALVWQKRLEGNALVLSDEARAGESEGLVFLGGKILPEASTTGPVGWVSALKLRSGDAAWTRQLGSEVEGLALVGDALYAVFNGNDRQPPCIAILGAQDGGMRGAHALQSLFYGLNRVRALTVREDRILIVSDDAVSAYSMSDPGQLLWRMPWRYQAHGPAPIEGDVLYVGDHDGLLAGDLRTGRWLWNASVAGETVDGPCAVSNGEVFGIQPTGGVLTAWRVANPSPVAQQPRRDRFGRPPADLGETLWRPAAEVRGSSDAR